LKQLYCAQLLPYWWAFSYIKLLQINAQKRKFDMVCLFSFQFAIWNSQFCSDPIKVILCMRVFKWSNINPLYLFRNIHKKLNYQFCTLNHQSIPLINWYGSGSLRKCHLCVWCCHFTHQCSYIFIYLFLASKVTRLTDPF